jgi:hypothetical protein
MNAPSKSRRRWFGAICLLGALGMLLAGQTQLQSRLTGAGFIAYWLGCFGLTLLAMGAALMDALALRREGRAHQRELIESTVNDILAARKSPPDKSPPPASPE